MSMAAPPPFAPLDDALPGEVVAHRLTLHGVSWSLYDQLLALAGNGLPRMAYDRGTLEMEMPSKRHEALKGIVGRFIEAFAEESAIEYEAADSTTWRVEAFAAGLEADESYYIQHYAVVQGREVDLAVEPPPDLAVEIDLSPPDVEKASVYARLGVPEIWRWRNARLAVLVRMPDGSYAEQAKSLALPSFPLGELSAALSGYPQRGAAQSVTEFRGRLRSARA